MGTTRGSEFSEIFENAACREVLEEIGLIVQDPVLVGVTNDIFALEHKHRVFFTLKGFITKDQVVENHTSHKTVEWR